MRRLTVILLLALAACGHGPSPDSPAQSSAALGGAGVEISGTLRANAPAREKLLVFAYVNLAADAVPAAAEPASVGAVAPDRSFLLSNVPPGNVTLLFLVDKGNDGAIDPGDPIAVLDDPEHRLASLQPGDEVMVRDIAVDAPNEKAVAAAIDVKRATDPTAASAPSATPSG